MGLLDRFRKRDAATPAVAMPSQQSRPLAPPVVPQVPQATIPRGGVVMVVGESHYQDAISAHVGGKTKAGHWHRCLATLAPEPGNPYDGEAVVVLIDGRTVGYLSRGDARAYRSLVDTAIATHGVAVVEACITGGWERGSYDEGSFGVELVFDNRPAEPDRPRVEPPFADEIRLRGSGTVSVSHEEHYQEALGAAISGASLDRLTYPVLAELVQVSENPHAKKKDSGEAIEVRVGGRAVGYLTPAMTARFQRMVRRSIDENKRLTCSASIFQGGKGNEPVIEIRLSACPHAEDESVVVDPYFTITVDRVKGRTGMMHKIESDLGAAGFKTQCGRTIKRSDAEVYASTKPWIGDLNPETHEFVPYWEHCAQCGY